MENNATQTNWFCPVCGTRNNGNFCTNCGEKNPAINPEKWQAQPNNTAQGPSISPDNYQPNNVTPPPTTPHPPKQKRIWPWVILASVVGVLLMGIGGCTAASIILRAVDATGSSNGYSYQYPYGTDNAYSYGGSIYDDEYTLEEIKDAAEGFSSTVSNGEFRSGMYTVGTDINAGLYYVEGSNTEMSCYYVFQKSGDNAYRISSCVVYYGNYFINLKDGEILLIEMMGNGRGMLADKATSFKPTSPYGSGCYRVGTDIPAGTYVITADSSIALEQGYDSGAFVMKDLEFSDSSILSSEYVIKGGKKTVTVENGQYLELFAATATPAN